jgi:hypothetical protein
MVNIMVSRFQLACALAVALAACSSDRSSAGDGPGGPRIGDAGSSAASEGFPDGFWDSSDIPIAQNVMMFKFLNRTNGKFGDEEVYWRFQTDTINEVHSIADAPTYDMPAKSSGRMYFFLCAKTDPTCTADPTKSKYVDFIEFTIGDAFNGNITRVDRFGVKLAIRLHGSDGFELTRGEDAATFAEDRDATFQAFLDQAPDEFKPLAMPPFAPYGISQPGAAGFDTGGPEEHYYDSFVDELWTANGITIDKPKGNAAGLAQSLTDLSAAIYRHVGATPGMFGPDGVILKGQSDALWKDSSTFYQAAPSDYYARFLHSRSIDGKTYAFPYDDVGGYAAYISHSKPQYLLVAIGW